MGATLGSEIRHKRLHAFSYDGGISHLHKNTRCCDIGEDLGWEAMLRKWPSQLETYRVTGDLPKSRRTDLTRQTEGHCGVDDERLLRFAKRKWAANCLSGPRGISAIRSTSCLSCLIRQLRVHQYPGPWQVKTIQRAGNEHENSPKDMVSRPDMLSV
ncbi:hypothetical protein V2G26_009580 [Clonostachys chloroleuca]